MTHLRTLAHRQSGLSMIELMIALAIGLMLLAALTLIFVNSSHANRELQKTAQQIENGRYAVDIITQDLHHAGYFGYLYDFREITAVIAVPDPCETASVTNLTNSIPIGIQGFRAADLATRADVTATTCDDKGLLTAANMKPGSDVLVVRRASTVTLAVGAPVTLNDVYIQTNGITPQVKVATVSPLGAGRHVDGAAAVVFFKDGVTAAPVRKYVVHVYFVAPCSVGTGANGVCQAGDDTIPTLKRLELGAGPAMTIVPLVEGIEYLKVEYGIDTAPGLPENPVTRQTGDSTIDNYVTAPGDWTEVIGARVYVVARNTSATADFADDKSYVLGSATVAPANYAGSEGFRRHSFAAAVRLTNVAGRREIP